MRSLLYLCILFSFVWVVNSYFLPRMKSSLYSMFATKTDSNEIKMDVCRELIIGGNDKETKVVHTKLSNGISVIIVHDPNSIKSAASLSVKVGALNDPIDMPGLTHFTEHAVFLGSEKFPEENVYKSYLNKNGGSSNAGTSMESTVYQFDINSDKFEYALNIFSNFFKSPLFTSSAIGREIMAVDSEDAKNRIIDGRRVIQIVKDLIIDFHPYKKFSTGNVHTIANGEPELNSKYVRDRMQLFHSLHYIPSNMSLVLVGPQSVNDMLQYAREYFSNIEEFDSNKVDTSVTLTPDPPISTPSSALYPFKPDVVGGTLIKIKPVKDIRSLSILFPLPSTRAMYKEDPTDLLSYIIAYKNSTSLFAFLQGEEYITSLSAGAMTSFQDDFQLYEIAASLTEKGLANYQVVIQYIYSYIDFIKSELKQASKGDADGENPFQRIWSELRSVNYLKYRYQAKDSPYELAQATARNMLYYPVDDVFSVGYLLNDHINLSKLQQVADMLTTSNAVTFLRSKTFDDIPDDSVAVDNPRFHREKWYGSYYTRELLDLTGVALDNPAFQHHLTLPAVNKYVSHNLIQRLSDGISDEPTATKRILRSPPPVQLPSNSNTHVHHSRDVAFAPQPKAAIYTMLYSMNNKVLLNSLFNSIYDQLTMNKYYDASTAGLHSSIQLGMRGIHVTTNGFSDIFGDTNPLTQLNLVTIKEFIETVRELPQHPTMPQLFHICKEKMLRSLHSWNKERPDVQADGYLGYILAEYGELIDNKITELQQVTMEEMVAHVEGVVEKVNYVNTYVHGNIDEVTATDIHKEMLHKVVATASYQPGDEYELPSRARLVTTNGLVMMNVPNTEDENSAYVQYFQCGPASPKLSAYIMLTRRLFSEPLFDTLRTKKQLGYIVHFSTSSHGRGKQALRGLSVKILSKRYDPVHMQGEVDAFFSDYSANILPNLSQEEVSSLANSLILSLSEPPKSYLEESNDFWNDILNDMPHDWVEQVKTELKSASKDLLIKYITEWLYNPAKSNQVTVMLFGKDRSIPAIDAITTLAGMTAFRQELPFYEINK